VDQLIEEARARALSRGRSSTDLIHVSEHMLVDTESLINQDLCLLDHDDACVSPSSTAVPSSSSSSSSSSLPSHPSRSSSSPRNTLSSGAVFLTGATGFLGGFLLRDLVRAGREVYCLIRNGMANCMC
jgi:Male sterility protein